MALCSCICLYSSLNSVLFSQLHKHKSDLTFHFREIAGCFFANLTVMKEAIQSALTQHCCDFF